MSAKLAEKAVHAARLYMGSTACGIRQQQRFYDRMRKAIKTLAVKGGADESEADRSVMDAASGLGAILPIPGKDY